MTRNETPHASADYQPSALPLHQLAEGSRFVQRIRRRYADLLPLLPAGLPTHSMMQSLLLELRRQNHNPADSLRVMRNLVQERLVVLDCDYAAPLSAIVRCLTQLAEVALHDALAECTRALDEVHGAPLKEDGTRSGIWIMGMGKLGARELNASSDIDLIYVYECEGETAGGAQGRGVISNHEYFAKLVRAISTYIAEVTGDGFVFRVDLALRPNGNSGPPAISLAALEEYFLVQGREWERFAWLKSRAVACWPEMEKSRSQRLTEVVLPFVFRKHLDYGVFESLRTLHAQIRSHTASRACGRSERECDVKLSRGGIREVEFTVQLLQVVRGGQYPELRVRATLKALPRLVRAGLMPEPQSEQLAAAYDFLRRVEHRIQYLDDLQTHILPRDAQDLAWIAATMGCADSEDFFAQLQQHRDSVAGEFELLLGASENQQENGASAAAPDWADLLQLYRALKPDAGTAHMLKRLEQFETHPKVRGLREESRARLLRLLERIAQYLGSATTTTQAVVRFLDWLESLLRRESYLALLQERPIVLERLLLLLGAARWPARYLQKHPGLIDELAGQDMLTERFNAAQLREELELRYAALVATGEDDEETLLDVLRRAHHAEVFRTLARDVEGAISVEQVADDLSLLAETMLGITVDWCWQRLKQKHREQPAIGIIAYGKLGGKELGYGGDLDIVFVYDDEHENASEIYAAFVRKLISWMTVKTAEGDLFEIDMALRPNGSSGLLVISFAAYTNYQQQRGSNTAWLWEHQAMTRARFIWGNEAVETQFNAVRTEVLTALRDVAALKQEIIAMRKRMVDANKVPADKFDVKYSAGGMIDAEFAVQYLVLAHAREHAELLDNVGNIALLKRCDSAGLLPSPLGSDAADAYRELRRFQHKARLDEQPTQTALDQLLQERAIIQKLWQVVFA